MKEYIEREAVEEMLESAQTISDGEYCGYCTEDINLSSIPAADVAPVRHGRWILVDKNGTGVCSECNRQDHIDSLATHCRYCGALMDRKENTDWKQI